MKFPSEGRQRVVIEGVAPEIDGGQFPIKRTVGDVVNVRAFVLADGHDSIVCEFLYKSADTNEWLLLPMTTKGSDRWEAEFPVSAIGRYFYTVLAWIDRFETWRSDLKKRIAAGQELSVELLIGAELLEQAPQRAAGANAARLQTWGESLRGGDRSDAELEELSAAMRRYPDVTLAVQYERELAVVDRQKARFSTWYEIFPRSTSSQPGRYGTFADCEERLPYGVEASPLPMHGRQWSLSVTAPTLGVTIFKAERA